MKNTNHDRRSKRTRRLLGQAIVELMSEKRYDDITVQDLLVRADVGRSTFYSHYLDKEDLLLSEFERMVKDLEQHALTSVERESQGSQADQMKQIMPSLELLRHIRENRHLYKALVWGGGTQSNLKKMQGRLAEIVAQNLVHMLPVDTEPAVPLAVISNFVVSAFLVLVNWWLDDNDDGSNRSGDRGNGGTGGIIYSPEEVDGMFRRLVMPGVRLALAAGD